MDRLKHSFVLITFCVVLFLPGLAGLPPLDRDEARYAQASKQMLETGDAIDIRFQDHRAIRNRPALTGSRSAPIWPSAARSTIEFGFTACPACWPPFWRYC